MTAKKNLLQGCVFPVIVPFTREGSSYPIDYKSLKRYCQYLVDQGAKIIMVASATSRFAQLSLKEIKEVNAFVFKVVAGRALVIASTPILGSTEEHIEVTKEAEALGIEVIACDYPWRYQTSEAMVDYFQSLSNGSKSIKFMMHVTPGRSELGGTYRFDLKTLESVLSLDRVIGMKEASGDKEHSRNIWKTFKDKTSIIVAGMSSQTYLEAFPYGVHGYFVGSGNAVPKVSIDIFNLLQQGDFKTAENLIKAQELPFLTEAKKMGWHAAIKAILFLMGLMEKTERPPMVALSETQISKLKTIIETCGWLEKENNKLYVSNVT
jgi:dihydrodipicolinate synthase/N-acetylneuraminate lyase